jgi:hypothetical protein
MRYVSRIVEDLFADSNGFGVGPVDPEMLA